MSSVKIAIVYHSRYGHTKVQAEAVKEGVESVQGVQVMFMTAEEAIADIDSLDSCDGMIFGSPTYMGSMSADMKKFIEVSVSKWGKQVWQNKIAGGFSNSSNLFGDKSNTMIGLATFAMQQGMIWVGLGDLVASNDHASMKKVDGPNSNAINRVSASFGPMAASFEVAAPDAPGHGDLATARNYGKRIAEITKRFNK